MLDLALSIEAMADCGSHTFTPASLAPTAWYDPSDLSTLFQDSAGTTPVTASGQPVGKMLDKSGNGNHLTQTTAANRPTYTSDASGKYLLFDGVNDSIAGTWTMPQPLDRISALQQLVWVSGAQLYNGATSNGGVLAAVSPSPDVAIWDGGSTPAVALPTNAPGVVTERHAGASSRIAANNGAYATADAGAAAPGGLTIGSAVGGAANFCNMRFYGSVMKVGTLTDPQIGQLRTYLGAKCGLTL